MRRLSLTVCIFLSVLFSGPLFSATGTAVPFVKPQYFDSNGDPLSGAKLFVYTAGTSTKITTYSDAAMTTPNTNPVVLDSAGRASIFVPGGTLMKLVMAPSTDSDPPVAPLWTVDGVSAVPPASTSADVDVTATAGENLSTGDLVCLSDGGGGNTAGRWYKCDADFTYLSNLAPAVGVANAAISTGSAGTVRRLGRITDLSGLVAGTLYYASATAGALTSSKPTNARAVGTADSTTTLILVPTPVDASSTFSGSVSTGTQTIAGAKTFSSATTFSSTTLHSGVATFTPLPLGVFQVARQTGDLTKNNNTTFADLSGLAFSVAASGNYYFRCFLKVNSTGAAGLKVQLTGPAAPTGLMFGLQSAALKVDPQAATAFSTTVRTGTGDIEETVTIEGYLRNGANAGTVQVQAAQDTADVSDTIIRADSFCIWMQQS